ncbi:MAG: tRNA threonylcarbamoyladenosine dehydratase, partial [Solobacterium sp.]|nr:tRNA threonylcarbamoyladenosine dehydratase [Solobacterium sp.]
IPGSTAFVPPVAGITLAAEVVRQITNFDPNNRK